ncbi:hypothetical protein JCM14124_16990 [Humidesulfovibrio idahonensis]
MAVIGLALRLPGANDLHAFWKNLRQGRCHITPMSEARRRLMGPEARARVEGQPLWGAYLDDVDRFDAGLFRISPREARTMDPQQRLALELSRSAMEDAGLAPSSLAGSRTGVFMGVCHWDHAELFEHSGQPADAYLPTGLAYALIANRVSFAFDLTGPSVVNDTACAASLVSVCQAVDALRSGQCELALAGGVNVISAPNHFLAFAKNGMLSKTGSSLAFDSKADGYVRGEGGAVLLLKPLIRALADGDPIHAVIRGHGVNHGGRTSALTVTNPRAQARVIAEAHRQAGGDPQSVGFIEAHGPGTPVGDPIEVLGLKLAFAELYREAGTEPLPGSCGLGSVKTNIGHLEGAAGVAGLVKVIAAMHHGQLPPNAGFAEENALLKLAGGPFHVLDRLRPWPRGKTPRRAGVSAFGFGGVNAHVVLEEPPRRRSSTAKKPAGLELICLSARDPERLAEAALALASELGRRGLDVDLRALARTLHLGRDAMEARLAIVAAGIGQLRRTLTDWREGRNPPGSFDGVSAGQAAPSSSELSDWLAGRELARLAEAWAGGATVDWLPLYGGKPAERLRLPTYPYARERHWLFEDDAAINPTVDLQSGTIPKTQPTHHEGAQQTHFAPDNPLLAQHEIDGLRTLPGTVGLALVCAALTARAQMGDSHPVRLSDVLWLSPLQAGPQGLDLSLTLSTVDARGARFALVAAAEPGIERCRGLAEHLQSGTLELPHVPLTEAFPRQSSIAALYDRLRLAGIAHGPAFHAVRELRLGKNMALARLRLPDDWRGVAGPGPLAVLLDAAIQAGAALPPAGETPGVPFALERADLLRDPGLEATAVIRFASTESGSHRLDIDIFDASDRCCALLRGLTTRPAKRSAPALFLAVPVWTPRPAAQQSQRVVRLLWGGDLSPPAGLAALLNATVEPLSLPQDPQDAAGCRAMLWTVAHAAREMLERPEPSRLIVALQGEAEAFWLPSLAALLGSLGLESSRADGRVVLLPTPFVMDAEALANLLGPELHSADHAPAVSLLADGQRLVRAYSPRQAEKAPAPALWPSDGVVWITGGAGGLGRLFVERLAKAGAKDGAAAVAVSGRSPHEAADPLLRRWAQAGIRAEYIQLDVTDAQAVQRAAAGLRQRHGRITGVLHCAGVLRDSLLRSKVEADFQAVLAPKVDGAVHLDAATAADPLDFFLMCSSVASLFGNAGQSDYAAANGFLDAFAAWRAGEVLAGRRSGRSLAVCWPLWESGGMRLSPAIRETVSRRMGMAALPTETGLSALQSALNGHAGAGSAQVAVGYGDALAMTRFYALGSAQSEPPGGRSDSAGAKAATSGSDSLAGRLLPRLRELLRGLLGRVLSLPAASIRADAPMSAYGFDSIVAVEMTAELEKSFGTLPKTLFFEHTNLDGVARWLLAERPGACLDDGCRNGSSQDDDPPSAPSPLLAAETILDAPARSQDAAPPQSIHTGDRHADDRHDIAIIGLGGRYPGAANLDDFWENILSGRHAFRPVPGERWDHSAIYHPERDVLGKSTIRTGTFLDGIDRFDPRYFNISQREAELMSPEVRLFLEVAVETFEDAGYSRETMQRRYGGDVAVLAGTMSNHYNLYGFQNMLTRGARASGSYTGALPNMVSYFYGLTGPSMFVDTMCSTASVCIDMAVRMLRTGQTRMALAGAVNLLLHPYNMISSSQEHFTTKTGEVIRSFGLGADGTILGEGVGAVLLKPLADALRDGDAIRAVIRGTAVTNAGVRNGFTVPTPAMQAKAVRVALDDAGVDARTISYVEGHGSGTSLGDPIEISALASAYRPDTNDRGFCAIGSVKSNVGHLLAAAGMAGLTKVLFQMRHGLLAPSLNAETLNPAIDFEATPFVVQRSAAAWPRPGASPRRAGLTSIGAGGVNAHMILEEHEPGPEPFVPPGPRLLVVSAMRRQGLEALLLRLLAWLDRNPDSDLARLAYTLQAGRTALPCRLAFVAETLAEARAGFEAALAGAVPRGGVFTPNVLAVEATPELAEPEALVRLLDSGDLDALARAFAAGADLDWDRLWATGRPRPLPLPAYPFEKTRCWYEVDPDAPDVLRPGAFRHRPHALLGGNEPDLTGVSLDRAASEKAAEDDPPPQAPDHGPGANLRSSLRKVMAEILKFAPEDIDPRSSFQSLGFDSISLAELARRVGDVCGLALSPAVFYEAPTLERLTRLLHGKGARPRQPQTTQPAAQAPAPVAVGAATPVAIIGAACRLPGAPDLDAYWQLLVDGREGLGPLPLERYGADYAARMAAAPFPQRGGFLEDAARFDADFFALSPVEALRMDPQHRLFLETAWLALESAGLRPVDLPRETGVFAGVSGMDYAELLRAHGIEADAHTATGNSHAMLTNRLSFLLDLHGPSEAIDTACSSSLVAVTRAVEAIRSGRCPAAFAGGVNMALSLESFMGPHQAGMLSPEGRCKTFGSDADGYVRGEGAGVVLLKPLEAALRDGDPVLGVIAGAAENHGGRAGSLTAPNTLAQAEVIVRAMAGIDPATVVCVETHGTGTRLGDPVEVEALKLAYSRLADSARPVLPPGSVPLASVKTNIGHLEAAAGIAGLLKAMLSLRHGLFPAGRNQVRLNPYLDFSGGPFFVAEHHQPLTRAPRQDAAPLHAGVSSFGFGGSNAHVVLEAFAAPPSAATPQTPQPEAVILSARTPQALRARAEALLAALPDLAQTGADLAGIAHTLQTGREPMEQRLAFLAHSLDDVAAALRDFLAGKTGAALSGRARLAGGFPDFSSETAPADPPTSMDEWRALLSAWVEGRAEGNMDWKARRHGPAPRRVVLPGYAFGGERHWPPLDPPERAQTSDVADAPRAGRAEALLTALAAGRKDLDEAALEVEGWAQ